MAQKGGGFFSSIASSLSNFKNQVNGLLGYEGLEVINPEGGTEDAEVEAQRGRWKQEDRDSHWKMMQKYVGADITSMVTLPVLIFEPMNMLQKMAELMEYSHLLELADKCEDPHMRMVYAGKNLSLRQTCTLTRSHMSHLVFNEPFFTYVFKHIFDLYLPGNMHVFRGSKMEGLVICQKWV